MAEPSWNFGDPSHHMPGLNALEDHDLIERSRAGDERAFRALVDRYEPTVAGVVIGMLGNGAEADDVGQEVFVRFFRAIDRFRGDSSVATYLTRIAINQSLKAINKRRRWYERFLSRDAQTLPEEGRSDSDPVADALSTDRSERLTTVLNRLPPDQRAVIVLRVMEGHSTRDTADLLGVPEGTVMSRLKRGLAKMRSMIEMEHLDL